MHTGMLWLDTSSESLSIKIQKAVDYYQKKYGRNPDLCLIHPSMLADANGNIKPFEMGENEKKIYVRPFRPVLPGHIWIGIEDKN